MPETLRLFRPTFFLSSFKEPDDSQLLALSRTEQLSIPIKTVEQACDEFRQLNNERHKLVEDARRADPDELPTWAR